MGLLDWVDPAREKFIGLLSGMPISQAARGNVSVGGLLDTLKAMPKFDKNAKIEDQSAFWNPAGMLGKIVYHGSPHKFDKFDASKIGTGEGAQAYGHGTYLADSQGVAKGYADGLSVPEIVSSKGRFNPKSEPITDPKRQAYNVLTQAFQNQSSNPFGLASKYARENIDNPDVLRQVEKHLLEWQEAGAKMESGGALYKADLPDEWIPKMLDWDKPLKDQPEIAHALRRGRQGVKGVEGFSPETTGGSVLERMAAQPHLLPGFKVGQDSRQAAANALRDMGIPGIRYLDGGSRGAGQGSYNYVVFPGLEDQVKILERNGIPLGLLGGK